MQTFLFSKHKNPICTLLIHGNWCPQQFYDVNDRVDAMEGQLCHRERH